MKRKITKKRLFLLDDFVGGVMLSVKQILSTRKRTIRQPRKLRVLFTFLTQYFRIILLI